MSIGIIWPNRQRLVIMLDRLIDVLLRHKSVAENNVSVRVIWL